MRCLIYYPRAMVGNGGPTVAVWLWADALRKGGADVLVVFDEALSAVQPLSVKDVDQLACDHKGNGRWRRPVNLAAYINKGDVVFLHSAFLAGNLVAAKIARRCGAYPVFVPHGAYNHAARRRSVWLKRMWLLWESCELEKSLAVHAFVETEKASIREVAPSVPILIAPTPIAIPKDHWRGGGGYGAWFGRYDIEVKGLDLLIEAYRRVPAEYRKPIRLRGRDSTDGRLAVKSLVDLAGLSSWIDVGPSVEGEEKLRFLQQADFFVMPSRWESFSIALLEVLALGVPSIVSCRQPIAESLKAENACRVTDIDFDSLSAELIEVFSIGPKAFNGLDPRGFVERHLSAQAIGSQFVSDLKILLSKK